LPCTTSQRGVITRLNDLEKAKEEFLISRDVDSTEAETLTGLGYVKINREEAQEAPDCYREALKI
jgi:Flp pilus assembly protein TadD